MECKNGFILKRKKNSNLVEINCLFFGKRVLCTPVQPWKAHR